jgi:hypothetical protein
MRILADAAEDEGNTTLASGWRWLADNKKWPSQVHARPSNTSRKAVWGFHWIGIRRKSAELIDEAALINAPSRDYLPSELIECLRKCELVSTRLTGSGGWLHLLCESEGTLLKLTAQAAGEWLASQQKKESEA